MFEYVYVYVYSSFKYFVIYRKLNNCLKSWIIDFIIKFFKYFEY